MVKYESLDGRSVYVTDREGEMWSGPVLFGGRRVLRVSLSSPCNLTDEVPRVLGGQTIPSVIGVHLKV